jgi:hypothetical protein
MKYKYDHLLEILFKKYGWTHYPLVDLIRN